MEDIDVELISLVEDPATSLPLIMKSKGKSHYQLDFSIVEKSKEKSEIYATVYQPDDVDHHNDFTDANEIAKMAHRFLSKGRQANVDIEHDGNPGAGTVVESFILNGTDERFPSVKSGSWCVVIKMSDRAKKSIDKIKGVSMYGTCKYAKSTDNNIVMKGNGEFLRDLRITADVGDTEMARVLGLDHGAYLQVESGETDYEFTGDILKSIAKKVKKSSEEVAAMAINGYEAPTTDGPDEVDDTEDVEDDTDLENADAEQKTKRKMGKIRAEKSRLRSGRVPIDGDGTVFAKAKGGKPTNEDIREIAKSVIGLSGREGVRKDNITTESLAFEGTLSPSVATELYSLVIGDDTTLLGKVKNTKVRRPKGEIDVADLELDTARRITAGSPPGTGDNEGTINKNLVYECKEMDLKYTLEKKTLRDYSGDLVGLETRILMDFFVPSLRRQMLRLGFTGTSDTYVNTFESLGKGWLQVARDKCPAGQVLDISTLSLDANDPQEIMAKMKEAILTNNPAFYTPDMKYILSVLDMHKYGEILKARPDGISAVYNGANKVYDAHELLAQNLQPSQYYLMSHLDNMVLVLQVADGQNDGVAIERNPVQKGTEIILTAALDFEFINPQGVVTVKP